MTTYVTQTPGLYNTSNYTYGWKSNTAIVGTSISYTYSQAGQRILRSNAGTAMSDTLPLISNTSGDNIPSAIWNGGFIEIQNNDVTTLILTAATGNTVAGVAAVSIPPGQLVQFYSDGVTTDWKVLLQGASNLITVSSGAAINLAAWGNNARFLRSDATVAMTDTLPNANTLPLNWSIFIRNNDASATDTITPVTSTINGSSTFALAAGKSTTIYTDGANYFANTAE
ncbi:MAG TPA: hypothetical protein VHZ76_00690 [Gammaproteobacteria bacterium]|jgi:hypothetical protein|nr:hypothetical protein [Gammaproteobacteria bacterium]